LPLTRKIIFGVVNTSDDVKVYFLSEITKANETVLYVEEEIKRVEIGKIASVETGFWNNTDNATKSQFLTYYLIKNCTRMTSHKQ